MVGVAAAITEMLMNRKDQKLYHKLGFLLRIALWTPEPKSRKSGPVQLCQEVVCISTWYIRYPIVLYTSLSHSIGLTQYSKLLSTVSCCEERLLLEIQLQTVKLEGKKFARGMIGMTNNWQNTANIEKNWQTTIKQPWAIISWCSYALVIARRPPWKNPAPLERPDGGRTQASVSVEVIISPNYITILLKYWHNLISILWLYMDNYYFPSFLVMNVLNIFQQHYLKIFVLNRIMAFSEVEMWMEYSTMQ